MACYEVIKMKKKKRKKNSMNWGDTRENERFFVQF